jgi:hypothetical protein
MFMLEQWLHDPSSPRWFGYYFVNWSSRNLTTPPSLAPSERYQRLMRRALARARHGLKRPVMMDMLAASFFAADYFVSESSARWLFRGNDDTFINFRELPTYINDLERAHDPVTEVVIRGNCVAAPWVRYRFVHGGSGFLFSRAAVESLLPMAEQLMGYPDLDDVVLTRASYSLGHTPRTITSDRFIGMTLTQADKNVTLARQYDRIAKCRPTDWGLARRGCRTFRTPVRKVVFFHPHERVNNRWPELAAGLFAAPPSVVWWMEDWQPRLCRV